MLTKLYNLFNPITATITLSRLTSQDENIVIAFNVKAKDSLEDAQNKVKFFGDVAHARMVHNNMIALDIEKQIREEANQDRELKRNTKGGNV